MRIRLRFPAGRLVAASLLLGLLAGASARGADGGRDALRARLRAERRRIEQLAGLATAAPPADAMDAVRTYAVPSDGSRDAAAAINRAIRAAGGRPLFFPAGIYLLGDSIRPIAGTKLYFSPQAELRRGFEGGNGDGRGALLQGPASFAAHDVVVVGGNWTNPEHRYSGRALTIIGSRWEVDAIRVSSWGPAQAPSSCVNVAGTDIAMRRCVLTGSAGKINQDGIRVMCGERITISDCYVESGDDCFCAFPTETNQGVLTGRGLADVRFERCFGFSTAARFLACGETAVTVLLGRATMSQLNAVPVSGIRFEDCAGLSETSAPHAPAFFVVSADTAPGATVSAIRFVGCAGIGGRAAMQAGLLNTAPGARCTDIIMEHCSLAGGRGKVLTITPTCSAVRIVDCSLDGIRTTRSQ